MKHTNDNRTKKLGWFANSFLVMVLAIVYAASYLNFDDEAEEANE